MEENVKILVLGASGMAGHVIALYLQDAGFEVTALTRNSFSLCPNLVLDLSNLDPLKKIIKKYDYVVNCVGVLNRDADQNKNAAVFLNSYMPHELAAITRNEKTQIIHLSTDCVFSGLMGPYSEDSFRDGQTFYDRTKALGELEDTKNLTLRNSIIGPDMHRNGIGLFNWFMRQTKAIEGYVGAIWSGVTTITLAKCIRYAIERRLCGLYHVVNNKNISKFELCKLFNHYFKKGSLDIFPSERIQTDKTLLNSKFKFPVPDYEDMVVEMRDWIRAHKELYPHYEAQL